ncbi:MAG: CPBP family glutamic-type intramembrane protease [Bdellovibrionota bacterium]
MRSIQWPFWILVPALLFAGPAAAEPNYHLVGWVNTFVPGGGSYLLGNYGEGALETTLEVGTFAIGYNNSKRSPLTLDGVPEDLPAPSNRLSFKKSSSLVCTSGQGGKRVCRTVTSTTSSSLIDNSSVNISKSLYADWLQEFGLKFHMVNVFEAYRKGAGAELEYESQKIDQTSTTDLFLAPFKWDNLKSYWVFPAVLVSAAALIYNYQTSSNDGSFGAISPLTLGSQRLYDFTYLGIFPVGSAAPEEMFYRGFLQNEFYHMVASPIFSVGMTTALYSFSHSSDERASAAATGAYEGIVTHANGGQLSKAIAFHFWANFLAGIYQIAVVRKESGKRPLVSFSLKF